MNTSTKTNRPDFIVVRHFPTPDNENGISRGWRPTGIDREAAEKLLPGVVAALKKYGVDRLISSTLPRAKQSMEMIAEAMGPDVRTESTPRLKTWDTGDEVAGKPEKETIPLRQKYIKNSEIEMPGGESWDDLMDRFGVEVRSIERRRSKGEEVALIGHGHQVLAAPAILTDKPTDPKALASLDEDYPPGGAYGMWHDGRVERLDKGESRWQDSGVQSSRTETKEAAAESSAPSTRS